MNIAVCVKPVPDPGHYNRITINPETKLLDRKGIPVIINPVDKNAIEAALQLKEQFGGKVVLVSMAPPDAGEILKEALAMGVDEAYLLSDRALPDPIPGCSKNLSRRPEENRPTGLDSDRFRKRRQRYKPCAFPAGRVTGASPPEPHYGIEPGIACLKNESKN